MKIGIVTYHRSLNYGTMIQAQALRTAIERLGHEAYFVDYWPAHQRRAFAFFSWYEFLHRNVRGRIRYVLRFLRTFKTKIARRRQFARFFDAEIRPFCRSEDTAFDVLVFGGDQIWRRQRFNGRQYNPVYFGLDSFHARWRISYAASMGHTRPAPQDEEIVCGLLRRLDRISAREPALVDFLRANGFSAATCVLDPVFLHDSADWGRKAGIEPLVPSPYLLFYDLQKDAFDETELRKIAAARGLGFVHLKGGAYETASPELRSTDGPYEFLNLVRHASFVATSSYHGLAFSLLFHRPFLASFPEKAGRAASLLGVLGLNVQPVRPRSAVSRLSLAEPDWESVDRALAGLRAASLRWLDDAIAATPST